MARSLWDWLQASRPGEFTDARKRTFERRINQWKRRSGTEPELFFAQEHRPGERLQADWTKADQLNVQIDGEPLSHKLVAVTLPYSNWQWARVCRSESFLSLKIGVQSAIWELGGVPRVCQTDNSSTVTHQKGRNEPGKGRAYNERYLGFMAAMGMKPGLIGVSKPHQNGDVESAHGHLLRAIEDALRLRGHRDFQSVNEYEAWLFELMRKRNADREPRAGQEKAALGPLPPQRWPEYDELEVRVSRESIARVGKMGYSVPARWAGRSLRARISESIVAFYDGSEIVAEVQRRGGDSGVHVDWRHVIGALQSKPGAMARWRHRESLFPGHVWRRLYDEMLSRYSEGRAEREYLGILKLALEQGTEPVEREITRIGVQQVDLDEMRRAFGAQNSILSVDFQPDLSGYDKLLNTEEAVSHV